MKRLGVFLLPPGWDASEHRRVIYLGGERHCESCPRTQHNVPARLEPGPLDPEASALTMRPPRLTVLNIGTQKDNYDVTTEN